MFGRIRFTHISVVAALLMTLAIGAMAQDGASVSPTTTEAAAPDEAYKQVPISLDVQEAEIGTVLRSLAGFSGTNIVASPRVVGKVTVKLEEVPWEEALRVILRSHSFDYVEESGIYRIDTAEELRKEKLDIERARKQVEDMAALKLGMVNLHYANAEETKDALEEMLTERGNIDVDVRTNSLIINDVQERVDVISQMAIDLDTKTPQVEINARLIDMDSKATRDLGINWAVNNFSSPGNNLNGGLDINNAIQNAAGDLRVGTVQNIDLAADTMAGFSMIPLHSSSSPASSKIEPSGPTIMECPPKVVSSVVPHLLAATTNIWFSMARAWTRMRQ